jgi:hypothetical protein
MEAHRANTQDLKKLFSGPTDLLDNILVLTDHIKWLEKNYVPKKEHLDHRYDLMQDQDSNSEGSDVRFPLLNSLFKKG